MSECRLAATVNRSINEQQSVFNGVSSLSQSGNNAAFGELVTAFHSSFVRTLREISHLPHPRARLKYSQDSTCVASFHFFFGSAIDSNGDVMDAVSSYCLDYSPYIFFYGKLIGISLTVILV